MLIAHEGRTDYRIVVAEDAIAPERTAARELQAHLEAVTGAQWPVCSEAEAAGTDELIVVGPGGGAREALPDVDWDGLGADGIVIRTVGDTLYLAGGRPRGTIYAVNTFLEDTVGFRWWTSTESSIPSRPTLDIPELNTIYVPRLRYREAFYKDALEGVFSTRCKCNGLHNEAGEEYGGHWTVAGAIAHTFYMFLASEKYFATHPEWYALRDGERTDVDWQLCLTNREMRVEFIKNALACLDEMPDADFIAIDQNDMGKFCQCDKCKALAEREGSDAGPLIEFVNEVAEAIEQRYPRVLVETLAYWETERAPKTIKPRPNVMVRLCNYSVSRSEPIAEGEQNVDFRDKMTAWSALTDKLFVWDYVTDFANYIIPHPNIHTLGPNLRFFVNNGAIGVFEQGDCLSGGQVGDFVELRAWLLSHLLWDPSRDEWALLEEFMKGYYGPAAEPLTRYIRLTSDAMQRSGARLDPNHIFHGDYLTVDLLTEATALFDEARDAVAGDPVLAARVRRKRLSLEFDWLLRYWRLRRSALIAGKPFCGPDDPGALGNAFVDGMEEAGALAWREAYGPLDERTKQLFRNWAHPSAVPPECRSLPEGRWLEVRAGEFAGAFPDDFVMAHPESLALPFGPDPEASAGMAMTLDQRSHQWTALHHISEEMAEYTKDDARWYLTLRSDAPPNPEGTVCEALLRRPPTGGYFFQRKMTAAEFADGRYVTVDMGSHVLATGDQVAITATVARPSGHTFLDRVYCVLAG